MEDDLIAVKTTDVKNGDIVIARLDDEVTVKFFNRKSSNIVELEPANEDFENIVINLESEQLHIEGKSVGLLRELMNNILFFENLSLASQKFI